MERLLCLEMGRRSSDSAANIPGSDYYFAMATVQLYAAARAAAGTSRVEVDAADLAMLVEQLKSDFPGLGRTLMQSTYLLNGTACKDLSTALKSSDQIDVMPRFAGG